MSYEYKGDHPFRGKSEEEVSRIIEELKKGPTGKIMEFSDNMSDFVFRKCAKYMDQESEFTGNDKITNFLTLMMSIATACVAAAENVAFENKFHLTGEKEGETKEDRFNVILARISESNSAKCRYIREQEAKEKEGKKPKHLSLVPELPEGKVDPRLNALSRPDVLQ